MGHAHHDFANALVAGLFDRQVQQRNQALGPFQREAFGAGEPLLNELFENRGVGQPREDLQLFLPAERYAVLGALHAILQPLADGQVVHVHELHGNRTAIGVAQPLQDAPQGEHVGAVDRVGRKRAVHVGFGEAVILRIELGQIRPRHPQGVDVGHQVSAHTVGPHQLVDAVLQQGHFQFADAGRGLAPARRWIEDAGGLEGRTETRRTAAAVAHLAKVAPPIGRDTGWVAQVTGIQLFEEAEAQAIGSRFAVAIPFGDFEHHTIHVLPSLPVPGPEF